MQVLAGDQRKDVVLTAGIHVETKQCKTLFINTASPVHAFQSEVRFEKYRRRNSGNRSLGEISGAILGRGSG